MPPLKIVLNSRNKEEESINEVNYLNKKRKIPANLPTQQDVPETKKLPVKKRPLNDFEKFADLRSQIESRRKNVFPVSLSKPPEGFKDYLMNKKTYLLQENAQERLRSMPLIQPPPSLKGPLREMFVQQEKERFKLRTKHLVEKEKLVLSVEQVKDLEICRPFSPNISPF